MSNASTIINYAWNILGEDGSTVSHPALQEATMLKVLDDANREWQRAFRKSGEPPKTMQKEFGIDLVADTTLSAAQAASAVTASLTDSSSFTSSGAIAIWDDSVADIEEFTSNAANVLSGVTGADWAHESGDTVQLLYALPSNFGSYRATDQAQDGVMTDSGISLNYTSGQPNEYQFSEYNNGTTRYLWLPRGMSGSVRVFYNKISTTIDETSDSPDWDTAYDFFGIYRLVEHGLRSRGNNPDKVQEARFIADGKLLDALKDKNVGKIVKTRPIGRRTNYDSQLYRTNFR